MGQKVLPRARAGLRRQQPAEGCGTPSTLDHTEKGNYKPQDGENKTEYKEGNGWAP